MTIPWKQEWLNVITVTLMSRRSTDYILTIAYIMKFSEVHFTSKDISL
jgi:hypothetical protein